MGYGEDLEAALQRVAALEQELTRAARAAGTPEKQRLLAELLRQLAETSAQVQKLQAACDGAAEAVTDRTGPLRPVAGRDTDRTGPVLAISARPGLASMKSLVDHNRSFPAAAGEGLGVLCPRCLALGERIEMAKKVYTRGIVLTGAVSPGTRNIEPAWCPRCAHLDFLRVK